MNLLVYIIITCMLSHVSIDLDSGRRGSVLDEPVNQVGSPDHGGRTTVVDAPEEPG